MKAECSAGTFTHWRPTKTATDCNCTFLSTMLHCRGWVKRSSRRSSLNCARKGIHCSSCLVQFNGGVSSERTGPPMQAEHGNTAVLPKKPLSLLLSLHKSSTIPHCSCSFSKPVIRGQRLFRRREVQYRTLRGRVSMQGICAIDQPD
jgi:hypothetical protein